MAPNLIVVPDADEMARAAAGLFARLVQAAVDARGRFSVALSGGGTPLGLYRLLAEEPYRSELPWRQIHLFWGDERAVRPTDPESNFGQVYRALITRVPIPSGHVHPIRGELDPEAAAEVYSAELEVFFGAPLPEFDLVLLGMGDDGHVAALFPGSEALRRATGPVAATSGSYRGRPGRRISLTLPAINAARHVLLLVGGEAKAPAVRTVLQGPPAGLPAEGVRPAGEITWILDEPAAQALRL